MLFALGGSTSPVSRKLLNVQARSAAVKILWSRSTDSVGLCRLMVW